MTPDKAPRVWMMAVSGPAPGPAPAPGVGNGSGSGCQPCLPPATGPHAALRATGPAGVLDRVLTALRGVRNPETGVDIVSEGWVGALDIGADEAVLGLWALRPGCRALHAIAEDAFAVLRSELPDTDLYVRELRSP